MSKFNPSLNKTAVKKNTRFLPTSCHAYHGGWVHLLDFEREKQRCIPIVQLENEQDACISASTRRQVGAEPKKCSKKDTDTLNIPFFVDVLFIKGVIVAGIVMNCGLLFGGIVYN